MSQMNDNKGGIKFGIACYRKEQWHLFKAAADDSDNIEDTYENWLQSVKQLEMKLIAEGYTIERVDIDVNDLVQWCSKNNIANTSETRSKYTAMLLEKRSGPNDR